MSYIYKYRINELLNKLPHEEYTLARRMLPEKMGVSDRTIQNWRYIKGNSGQMIPGDYLYQLAEFFGVSVAEMFNQKPKSITPGDLLNRCDTAQNLFNQ